MPSRKRSEVSVRRSRPHRRKRSSSRRPGVPSATLRTPKTRWELRLRSARHTHRIGTFLGRSLHGGDVVALYGDLGTGKTTLVRGIAAGLEIPSERVSSPTFVLIQTYKGRLPLAHADCYRLDDPRQLRDLELSDYWDGRWVVAVEWAEKAASELPQDRLDVRLAHHSPSKRDAVLIATGPRAARLLTRAFHAQAAASATPTRPRGRHKR